MVLYFFKQKGPRYWKISYLYIHSPGYIIRFCRMNFQSLDKIKSLKHERPERRDDNFLLRVDGGGGEDGSVGVVHDQTHHQAGQHQHLLHQGRTQKVMRGEGERGWGLSIEAK